MNEVFSDLTARIENLADLFRREIARRRAASGDMKVVGTLCLGAPVEILDAVGAIPLRLLQADEEDELRGGRFLSADSCSFCKSVLGALHRGKIRYDAVLGATTCDQMRRNLEIIARDLNLPVFIYNSPRSADSRPAREYAHSELVRVAAEIADWSGVRLDEPALRGALRERQSLRERLRSLRTAEKDGCPLISGREFLALTQLYASTSLEFFREHLPQIEAWINARPPKYASPPLRIALLGSCLGEGDDQIVRLVEESGSAAILYDAVCTGGRMLLKEAKDDDPFAALTELYHDQILCPFRKPNDALFAQVGAETAHLRIQGVIYKTLKYCHPWGFEARRFKERLGLPFLHLDHDYSPSAIGQMRTRIHAFLEQLQFRL
jgi:benzoyl-CoA reductase/2-hydroxyglutaryl-CoA dehydratase subunit BcrC/BadD/HgdB